MKMKKSLLLLFVVVMAVALVLVGCKKDPDNGTTPPDDGGTPPAGQSDLKLIMATGGTSGTYYPFGGVLSQAINNNVDYINVTINSTGASAENIQLVASDQAQLAIVQNDVMSYAYNGTPEWTGAAVTDQATLMSLYPEVCQIVVAADSGINTVEDLKGKKVSTGDVGSGVESNALQILAAYGLTTDDISAQHLGFGDSADQMKDRALDAFFVTAGTPNTAIMDLQTSRDVKILSLDADKIAALQADYPFYAAVTLTSDDYSFLTEDVTTVAVQATLMCSPNLDEQAGYDIVKALIENQATIAEQHAKGAYMSKETAIEGVSVPMHSGAAKYFTEQGLTVPTP